MRNAAPSTVPISVSTGTGGGSVWAVGALLVASFGACTLGGDPAFWPGLLSWPVGLATCAEASVTRQAVSSSQHSDFGKRRNSKQFPSQNSLTFRRKIASQQTKRAKIALRTWWSRCH